MQREGTTRSRVILMNTLFFFNFQCSMKRVLIDNSPALEEWKQKGTVRLLAHEIISGSSGLLERQKALIKLIHLKETNREHYGWCKPLSAQQNERITKVIIVSTSCKRARRPPRGCSQQIPAGE